MEPELLIRDEDLMAEIDELIDMHLEEGEPAVTQKTLKRLVKEGYTDFQARELIGHCVAYELTSDRGFDQRRYTLHLSYLPHVNFDW